MGGNLNIINQWGEPQKGEPNFKISVDVRKWGEHDFWLKFGGWKSLEGHYGLFLKEFTPEIYIKIISK